MKSRLNLAVFLCFLTTTLAAQSFDKIKEKVSYLELGSIIDYQPVTRHRGFFENDLRTYCYRGVPKTLGRLLESIELQLDIEGEDYTQYEGATPDEVREHYEQQRSLFSFSLFSQKRSRLQLSPFTQQCIGIETVLPYRLRLQHLRVDFWRVIQLSTGILLFVYAGRLTNNPVFYYITGILLGISLSFMLVIWLTSKLVPKRPMMYGVLIGGWTIGIYIIQMLWENLQVIVVTYRSYVFWYILVTGLISFFFCYRLGPPKNQRSKNIIKWVLQLISLALIYFSSYFEEATAAIIIITIVLHYFPRSILYKLRALFMRRFPPKRRLLTNEEYYEQGVRETTKALEELRAFASSPDCKQWKVMSQLSDPMRFAAFVEGASHLRDEEFLRFESSKDDEEINDSEFSVDEDEGNEHEVYTMQRKSNRSYLQPRRIPTTIITTRTPTGATAAAATTTGQQYLRQRLSRNHNHYHAAAEISDDNDDDNIDGGNVIDVTTSSSNSSNPFKMRSRTATNTSLNNSTRRVAGAAAVSPSVTAYNSTTMRRESPLQQRASVTRAGSSTRAARMVSLSQRSIPLNNSRNGSATRHYELRDFSGAESDD